VAVKLVREKMDSLDNEIKVESKVLFGLSRLNKAYSNGSIKSKRTKVYSQKEETAKVINELQADSDKIHALLSQLEQFQEKQVTSANVMVLDRKDLVRVLTDQKSSSMNGQKLTELVIRIYEQELLPFKNHVISKNK
jgi:hypothetical protein